MEVTISATPLTIAFFFSFFFFLSFDKPQFQFLFIYLFFLSYIFSISISIILLLKKKKNIATILFSFSPVLASHNSFLLFFPPQHFGQLNCHNSFFFPSPPQFWQLHCLTFFFPLRYNFSNSIATHNSYFSLSFLGTPPGQVAFWVGISVTTSPKFNCLSLPPSHHFSLISHTFSQNFGNTIAEICFSYYFPK